jgi:phage I-like protein
MDFKFEKDGWVHVMPLGEFPHAEAGVVQVIDSEALKAITEDFKAKAGTENFPGLLVDFDHFSMDTDKPSEAAGWITELKADTEGLWAKVRWTAKGESAVIGGEYRLVSPVFPKPSLCEDLGESRIRPRQLQSVALTNEPNIKGSKPLTNREPSTTAEQEKEAKAAETTPEPAEETPNRWSDASRVSALAARRAKNEARKAAALEHLKQLDQQRRDNRYKLKPLSPISTAPTSSTPIKSFTSNPDTQIAVLL